MRALFISAFLALGLAGCAGDWALTPEGCAGQFHWNHAAGGGAIDFGLPRLEGV